MNRRKFLQTAGIALGALALPAAAHESLSVPSQPTKPFSYHGYTSEYFFAPADDDEFWIVDGLRVGDVLSIEGERILIIGVNKDVSYNVVRGYMGSVAETHIGETFYRIVAMARI